MYYLRLNKDDNFGFVVTGINIIRDTDIPISKKDYNKFFELQSQGKQFRVVNPNGKTLFEILEEYVPIQDDIVVKPSNEDMFKMVLRGDMQSLAYALYPDDFNNLEGVDENVN